jgi:uncharacterized protein involved in exopolysaccharide biosynthesis
MQSLWRQKFKAFLFAFLFMALVLITLILIPKKYESVGKLFVQVGRGGVTLDPTTTTSQTITVLESRDAEINSVVDVLQSRGVLELVLDQDNLEEEILKSSFILENVSLPKIPFLSTPDGDEQYEKFKRRDKAVKKLQNALSVKTPRKAATITIVCHTESAALSKKLIEVLIDTYIEQHVKARQTDGSFKFFEEQLQRGKDKVDELSKNVESFKNEIGVMSIEGNQAALRQQISMIENELIQALSKRDAYKSQTQELVQMVAAQPREVTLESTGGMANQGSDLMRDRLYNLELAERNLSAKYQQSHPKVVAARKEVAEAKSIMLTQSSARTQVKRGLNQNLQTLELKLMEAKVNVAAADAEVKSYEKALKEANNRMSRLIEIETKLASMGRQLRVAEANFATYSEKQEEARINLALDKGNFSNVKVVQQPTMQVKRVSPKYSLILAASFLFSLVGAVCVAIFADQVDSSLNTEQDVEDILGLEVLGSIPNAGRRPLLVH